MNDHPILPSSKADKITCAVCKGTGGPQCTNCKGNGTIQNKGACIEHKVTGQHYYCDRCKYSNCEIFH